MPSQSQQSGCGGGSYQSLQQFILLLNAGVPTIGGRGRILRYFPLSVSVGPDRPGEVVHGLRLVSQPAVA